MALECKVRGCKEVMDPRDPELVIDVRPRLKNGNKRAIGAPYGDVLCPKHGRELIRLLEPTEAGS
jgi:hypothetical protein